MAQLKDTTIVGGLSVTDDVKFAKPLGVEFGGTGTTSFDTEPTQGSVKPVTSGGLYESITKLNVSVEYIAANSDLSFVPTSCCIFKDALFVGNNQIFGVYRSTDGGNTFVHVSTAQEEPIVESFFISEGLLYAVGGTAGSYHRSIIYSSNGINFDMGINSYGKITCLFKGGEKYKYNDVEHIPFFAGNAEGRISIYDYETKHWDSYSGLAPDYVMSITGYNDKLYFGSNGGYLPGTDYSRLQYLPKPLSNLGNFVTLSFFYGITSLVSYKGKLFIGTEANGLWTTIDDTNFIQNQNISTTSKIMRMCIYNDMLYIAIEQNGLWYSSDGITFIQDINISTTSTITYFFPYENSLYFTGDFSGGIVRYTRNYDSDYSRAVKTSLLSKLKESLANSACFEDFQNNVLNNFDI